MIGRPRYLTQRLKNLFLGNNSIVIGATLPGDFIQINPALSGAL